MMQTSTRINARRADPGRPTSGRRRILLYGAAALAVVAVVIGTLLVGRDIAENEAFRSAARMTDELSDQVGPLIKDAATADPARLADLNRAIADRKSAGFLKQVNIWGADGQVIYADDAKQIGRRLVPPTEVTLAISQGTESAEFEAQPEISDGTVDQDGPGFVEVYVPLTLTDGTRVAFEAYYDYPRVAAGADQLFRHFLPLVLGLLILLVVQLPVAALIRRIRRGGGQRRGMLDPTRYSAGRARIQAAANLHDGPIQDIAGVGYALGAVAMSVPEQGQPMMRQAQQSLQRAQRSLRRLMIDLYPLDLTADRLPEAISSLTGPLRQHGIDVHTVFEPLPELTDEVVHALYQGAHEALANVAEHAHATRVDITLSTDSAARADPSIAQLTITDDGIGLDNDRVNEPVDGHGLSVLRHRLLELGGTLVVRARPGHGTAVGIELPIGDGRHRR